MPSLRAGYTRKVKRLQEEMADTGEWGERGRVLGGVPVRWPARRVVRAVRDCISPITRAIHTADVRSCRNLTATDRVSAVIGKVSRLNDLKRNDDGSVDLYIGPSAPAGFEKNFMKTIGDDGWFVYFRLYAPLDPFFDKSFKLPDFELVK